MRLRNVVAIAQHPQTLDVPPLPTARDTAAVTPVHNSAVSLPTISVSRWLKCLCEYYSGSILPVFMWAGVKFRGMIRSARVVVGNQLSLSIYYAVLRRARTLEWVPQLARGCFSFSLAFEAAAQLSKWASNSTKIPSNQGPWDHRRSILYRCSLQPPQD